SGDRGLFAGREGGDADDGEQQRHDTEGGTDPGADARGAPAAACGNDRAPAEFLGRGAGGGQPLGQRRGGLGGCRGQWWQGGQQGGDLVLAAADVVEDGRGPRRRAA